EDVGNAKAVNNLRDTFDIVFARAVASLNILCEYSLPLIKTNGQFVALKGFDCDEEIEKAKTTINLLGGEISNVFKFNLDENNKRSIIVIKKISQTPTKYPRSSKEITKKPL
ncbi:MAG: RsmG family class I SAM-dependent methyltransferase, partial [Oscillospiraceae bacterium]